MGELITQLPEGRIEKFDDQEIKHASDIADPAKYRFSIPEDLLGPGSTNLGMVSCNTERPDGELDEHVTFGARQLSDGRWAFFVSVRYPNEAEVKEVLLATSDGFYTNVPVKAIPKTIALRARANGKLVCADGAGSQPLIANRNFIGEWEMFDVIVIE